MDTPDPLATPSAQLPSTEDPVIDTPGSDHLPVPLAPVSTIEAPSMATPDPLAFPLAPLPSTEEPIVYSLGSGPMFINLDPVSPGGTAFPTSGFQRPSETPYFDEACKSRP